MTEHFKNLQYTKQQQQQEIAGSEKDRSINYDDNKISITVKFKQILSLIFVTE